MSQKEILSTLKELQKLRRAQEKLEEQIAAAQDRIKAYMTEQDAETLTAGAFKVMWTPVTSTRLDAAALKKALPEVAARFIKTTTTRRFTVQ